MFLKLGKIVFMQWVGLLILLAQIFPRYFRWLNSLFAVINPACKLLWREKHWSVEEVKNAKEWTLHMVSLYSNEVRFIILNIHRCLSTALPIIWWQAPNNQQILWAWVSHLWCPLLHAEAEANQSSTESQSYSDQSGAQLRSDGVGNQSVNLMRLWGCDQEVRDHLWVW